MTNHDPSGARNHKSQITAKFFLSISVCMVMFCVSAPMASARTEVTPGEYESQIVPNLQHEEAKRTGEAREVTEGEYDSQVLPGQMRAESGGVDPNKILPPQSTLIEGSRTRTGTSLPTGLFKGQLVPAVIKILLGIAGTFALVAFSVAGVRLVVAHDNEEEVKKVKNIFMYSIVGLIIIAISYAVVYGILTLSFE